MIHVPDAIALENAHGEPIACATSAARRTRVEPGDRVAIIGLGFMGLLMLQMLRLKGPAELTGIDMRDEALATARRLGADVTTKPGDIDPATKVVLPYTPGDPRGRRGG